MPTKRQSPTPVRGPSNVNLNRFSKRLIDVFAKQTNHGEFPVYVKSTGTISNEAVSGTVALLMFGIDDYGWPYVRIIGDQSDWRLNDQPVQTGASKLNYLDVSGVGRGDLLTNASLRAKFSFQMEGPGITQTFYVCWSPLKGEFGVNPLVHP